MLRLSASNILAPHEYKGELRAYRSQNSSSGELSAETSSSVQHAGGRIARRTVISVWQPQ